MERTGVAEQLKIGHKILSFHWSAQCRENLMMVAYIRIIEII